MPNIPGATNALPGSYTDVVTVSRGVNVPGGSRIAAIIGEGSTSETIVSTAIGGGKDGLNPTFTTTAGADGRHFQLVNYPLVSNRTTIFKNGIPLVGLEELIPTGGIFSFKYDYVLDITSGHLLLQAAHLQDQGGAFYEPLNSNVGTGTISNLILVDLNAPPEIWTIRCSTVQRNPMNQPIASTASFLAYGSVSGALLDANGNPIIWVSNGTTVSNGILSFSISDGYATVPFQQGDAFTVIVASGVLVRSDSLTATEIPVANLNSPVLLQGLGPVVQQFGFPGTDNELSLGCQLAFANNAPNVLCVQAAPPLPRRTSFTLSPSVNSMSLDNDDFIFPLPIGVTPDFGAPIHFFVTNNSTNVETQILPNQQTFYTLDLAGQPTTTEFITSNAMAPSGYSYFYTVTQSFEDLNYGFDGYIGRNQAFHNQGVFSSPSVTFDSSYVGKVVKIINSVNSANFGLFDVTAVTNGSLYIVANGDLISGSLFFNQTYLSDFINETSAAFEVINPLTGLPVVGGSATDGVLVTSGPTTGTATLTSGTIDFGTLSPTVVGQKLQINGSTKAGMSDAEGNLQPVGNNGLYDIIAVSGFEITIRKALVIESDLEFEVLDPSGVSNYIVINHNVVPNGNGLRITLVDQRDAAFFDAGWINALASLEAVDCDIVVPLPSQTISVIFQNALHHCQTMSSILNRKRKNIVHRSYPRINSR